MRHHDRTDTEFAGEETAEHRPGPAEGHQGEVARIDPEPGDHLVHLDEHLGNCDLHDRLGGLLQATPKGLGYNFDGGLRARAVDAQRVVGERPMAEKAADSHRIGDGGARAAAAVAGRSRGRTGAFRTDLQHAEPVDRSDRAAAGADRGHRDARHEKREIADDLARAELRPAVDDEREIGAGPADIQRQHIGDSGVVGEVGRAHHARSRAGEQHADASRLAGIGVHDAAVRFRQHRWGRYAARLEPRLQRAEIVCDAGMDVAVQDGRRGALVFADDRPHRARGEDEQVWRQSFDRSLRGLFMGRVSIGMQKGHDQAGRPLATGGFDSRT